VPSNKKYPLDELIAACREFPLPPRKRITFEYVQLPGVNDSRQDVEDLVRLLKGLRCKINVIPFNPFPGAEFRAPTPAEVSRFEGQLKGAGFHVLVRRPRGRDVGAACGQLADLGALRVA
jgi:23S rRNA (adenine2503-C2)-methyltransferase